MEENKDILKTDQPEYVLEIKDLSIRYDTDDAKVYATGSISN